MKTILDIDISDELAWAIFCSNPFKDRAVQPFPQHISTTHFHSIIADHHLVPAVYQWAQSTPNISEDIVRRLKNEYTIVQRKALMIANETALLQALFEKSGVEILFLKGAPLAFYLYGDVSQKQSLDIDILIDIKDIDTCNECLQQQGYLLFPPLNNLTSRQLKVYQSTFYHYIYFHPAKKILVELHWQLFSSKYIFPKFSISELTENTQPLNFYGANINFISHDRLILYLAVHGSRHGWSRLYWLRDFAATLEHVSSVATICQLAEQMNIITPFKQSLYLVHLLYGYPLPDDFIIDGKTKNLTRYAIEKLTVSTQKLHSRKLHRIHRIFYLLKLNNRFRYKLETICKSMTNDRDWTILKLPDSLFFLYYILRPLIWFYDVYLHSPKKFNHQ